MCESRSRGAGDLGMCADDFACGDTVGGTVEEDKIADGVASHGELWAPTMDR